MAADDIGGKSAPGTIGLSGPERARGIAAVVSEHVAQSEEARTLAAPIVAALWDSGLMQIMNPKAAGGEEPSIGALIDTWQELAYQDGSVGWIGIANLPSTAFAAAYLPEDGFAEVFTANDNRVALGGQFAPNGLGTRVDGGYVVTGNWQFGSGTGHSEYVCGGFIPMDDGNMRMADNGLPEMLVGVFPRAEIAFTDGWFVQGLRGTGSYDYNVRDVFVPDRRVYPLFTRTPLRGGDLYRLGVLPLTAAGHAAWALGIARSALDDVTEIARSKIRMGDESTLAHRATFQRDLSHNEGMWRAARALVVDAFEKVYGGIAAGEPLTPTRRADLRIAATYATETCREVVEFAHLAAGTTAIRDGSRIERAFRDMYTGTQHTFIGERTYTDAAKLALGLIEDSPAL
ncbi:MAG: acyl-CoA dehydrogenase [Myxococcales bacterium]|nr:MAG: acyl-CoA dehydrogenase [Myxococcales bacterium]